VVVADSCCPNPVGLASGLGLLPLLAPGSKQPGRRSAVGLWFGVWTLDSGSWVQSQNWTRTPWRLALRSDSGLDPDLVCCLGPRAEQRGSKVQSCGCVGSIYEGAAAADWVSKHYSMARFGFRAFFWIVQGIGSIDC
jgi:hypothetical protein